MMLRYMGGWNTVQAVQRSNLQNWFPIFDYVKESCATSEDVEQYAAKVVHDISLIREQSLQPHKMLALKASSFTSHPFYLQKFCSVIKDAQYGGMHVLIDAEDNSMKSKEVVVWDYLKTMNMTSGVYKTYQMYRMDALDELHDDLREGKITSYKLVRGAYMHQDKSFIYANKRAVDSAYNTGVEMVIKEGVKKRSDIRILVATHNVHSVQRAIQCAMLNVDYKRSREQIKFAQLLGMADGLTEEVIRQDFHAYKYTPYGAYYESLPYLLRRLRENLDVLKHM